MCMYVCMCVCMCGCVLLTEVGECAARCYVDISGVVVHDVIVAGQDAGMYGK